MKIGILGAGLVGCFIGAHLQNQNHDVTYIGSERVSEIVKKKGGLQVTNLNGLKIVLNNVKFFSDSSYILNGFDYILITLKLSSMSDEVLSFMDKLDEKTIVVSFQNGVDAYEILKKKNVRNHKIVQGMFPFNVVDREDFNIYQVSKGVILIDDSEEGIKLCSEIARNLPITTNSQIQGILYGKLLFNLNNSINALAGVSIKEQLSSRELREILSLAQDEAIKVFIANEITPVSIGVIPANWLSTSLRLPNWLFLRLAASILEIDERAYSSMYQDLVHGRKTEVEFLNGKIVELGRKKNIPTPVNECLVKLINKAENEKGGSPKLSHEQIKNAIQTHMSKL